MKEAKDKSRITIEDLLKSRSEGLTIQDIMNRTKLARHTVLARLHRLLGEGKVKVRQINMAKLHYWNEDLKEEDNSIKLRGIKKDHVKKIIPKSDKLKVDFEKIKEEIDQELKHGKINKHQAQVKEQRKPISNIVERSKHSQREGKLSYIKTGVEGFDDLLKEGIPKGSSILVAGGAGSGKTVFCLDILYNHAMKGEKCLYMSFEESEERLIDHMENFGLKPKDLIKKKNLMIKRFNPFDITRSVDALLMEEKGELLIEIDPVIFPDGFKPDIIVVDSLTAIASAFTGKEDSYRIYIEQLFRFFEKIKATSFLITETTQIPTIFSQSGVEEFLADGVIVLYNIKKGNIREKAIEILKLRGAEHQKKIVAFEITEKGFVVYPDQEVFSEI